MLAGLRETRAAATARASTPVAAAASAACRGSRIIAATRICRPRKRDRISAQILAPVAANVITDPFAFGGGNSETTTSGSSGKIVLELAQGLRDHLIRAGREQNLDAS